MSEPLPPGRPEAIAYCRYCPAEFVVAGEDVTAFDVIDRVDSVERLHRQARRAAWRHELGTHWRPAWVWPLIDALLVAALATLDWSDWPLGWWLRLFLIGVTTALTLLILTATVLRLRRAKRQLRRMADARARWTRR